MRLVVVVCILVLAALGCSPDKPEIPLSDTSHFLVKDGGAYDGKVNADAAQDAAFPTDSADGPALNDDTRPPVDSTVDSRPSDVSVDAAIPDSGVDLPRPDTTTDGPSPDSAIDAPATDSQALPRDGGRRRGRG